MSYGQPRMNQPPESLDMAVGEIVNAIFDGEEELTVWEFNRRLAALVKEKEADDKAGRLSDKAGCH